MQVKKTAQSIIMGAAALASASALAFDFDGIYVLAGVGYAGVEKAQFNDTDLNENYGGATYGNPFELESDGNFAWRGGIGAWLTDNFALEFNYFGISDMDETKSYTLSDGSVIDGKASVRGMASFDISGLGRCYFTDNLWGFARLGVAYATVDRKVEGTSTSADTGAAAASTTAISSREDEGGMGASLGIGAQYDFTPMIGFRVEGSTIQALNDNDSYAVTGNVVLNFGEFM